MNDQDKQRIKGEIADLKSTNSRNREDIRSKQSMLPGAEPKQADELQKTIRGFENSIKANEQRIRDLERNIR